MKNENVQFIEKLGYDAVDLIKETDKDVLLDKALDLIRFEFTEREKSHAMMMAEYEATLKDFENLKKTSATVQQLKYELVLANQKIERATAGNKYYRKLQTAINELDKLKNQLQSMLIEEEKP